MLLVPAVSRGEWRMRVHGGDGTTEYQMTSVDSLTFFDSLAPAMVGVSAGSFTMGDGVGYCGVDEREITLTHSFYLGQHEVTNLEYLEALQWAYDRGYVTASQTAVYDNLDASTVELANLASVYSEVQFDGEGAFYLRESPSQEAGSAYPAGYDPADHPVKMVSWFGAARYCDWLSLQAGVPRAYAGGSWLCNNGDPYGAQGYRLPTDAEWEYAAQFDDERMYPWGNEAPDCSRANYAPNGQCVGWTSPAGEYTDAPAELGLSDMAGSVWEWCNDWYECHLGTTPAVDPIGPAAGSQRVIRGSAWTYTEGYLRCASRGWNYPVNNNNRSGFRPARSDVP